MQAEWVFVALGSNLGDRSHHLAQGREALATLSDTVLVAVTPVEETAPIGPSGQDSYLNQMALLRTTLEPRALLDRCLAIERMQGRVRRVRWGPRTLDLDIVRFGARRVSEPGLTIPHPELPNRDFWQRELVALLPYAQEDE